MQNINKQVVAGSNRVKSYLRRCMCYTTLNPAVGALAAIAWDSEQYDLYAWHSDTVNNTRITPNKDGWYFIHGRAELQPLAAGNRVYITVMINGAATVYNQSWSYGANWGIPIEISWIAYCTSDYYELGVASPDVGSQLIGNRCYFEVVEIKW